MPTTGSTSIFGMLRAAVRRLPTGSAPSMINAFDKPSLAKFSRSTLVFASFRSNVSTITIPSSLALAESACLSASARTFFGKPTSWLRGCGPNERPPPRNRLTRAEPCRAEPVPFCRYIFLPVRWISARFLTACVPARRLANCQTTQRWMRSVRGSRPKMPSDTVTEPALLPSSEVTFNSMSRALLGIGGGCVVLYRRRRRIVGELEFPRLRHAVRQLLLDGIAHRDPAAIDAGHRAFDQNKTARHIGLHHFQIKRGHPLDAEMTGHFLALEGLSRILTAARAAN